MSAKDFIPNETAKGASVSGDELEENFSAIKAKFPLIPEDIESCESGSIIWNERLDPRALPQSINNPESNPDDDGNTVQIVRDQANFVELGFDPLYVQSLGVQRQRLWSVQPNFLTGRQNHHFPAPVVFAGKRAFALCDRDNNSVVVLHPSGGDSGTIVETLGNFPVGTNPSHCVGAADGSVWVFCDEPSVYRISGNEVTLVLDADTLDTTLGVYGFRRAAINAFGTFLYAIAKSATTSGFYDRILRISVLAPTTVSATGTKAFDLQFTNASPPIAGSTGATTEVADLSLYYPDSRTANNSVCHVMALTEEIGGATPTEAAIWAFHGDDGSQGISWPRTFTGATPDDDVARFMNPTTQTDECGKFIVQWGTQLLIGCSYTNDADQAWAIVNYSQEDREAGGIDDGWNTIVTNVDSGRAPMLGSGCATAKSAFWVEDDGDVVALSRDGATIMTFKPTGYQWPTAPELGTGIAYNGIAIIINGSVSAADGQLVLQGIF